MVKKSNKQGAGSQLSRRKRPRKSAPHIRKGKIVEAIVKLLHDSPGLKVETNVELPPRHGDPERRREIDVLVTGNVAGYEVRIAFSCKNENMPIKPNLIDEFVGTLDDVGIPTEQGIFVCVNGYTKGALDRAKGRGIRTLVLKGLTKDRLDSEVAEALQFAVYLIEDVTRITVTNDVGTTEYPAQFLVLVVDDSYVVNI